MKAKKETYEQLTATTIEYNFFVKTIKERLEYLVRSGLDGASREAIGRAGRKMNTELEFCCLWMKDRMEKSRATPTKELRIVASKTSKVVMAVGVM